MTAAEGGVGDVEIAPAKLNLYLEILGRRDGGFHDLDSLVVFVDIGEKLSCEVADDLRLSLTGPLAHETPAGKDNLVLRAAQLLREKANVSQGAHLWLHKVIPVAAGLGGGSADAAAALRLLNRLWRLNLPKQDLLEIAQRLGSDVPCCLMSEPTYIRGTGVEMYPAQGIPEMGILIVHPGVALATADVYSRIAPTVGTLPQELIFEPHNTDSFISSLKNRRNDLTLAATAITPEIQKILSLLKGLQGARWAGMSGSGATCFALFDSRQKLIRAKKLLLQSKPYYSVFSGVFGHSPIS